MSETILGLETNLEIMFSPKTVAIVGASRRQGSIGRAILKNIIDFEFEGTVYPVNPNYNSVYSLKCYHSLSEIPEPIDLIIVVVPSKYVLPIIEEAVSLNVKSAVIITAGFKELGANSEGAKLEHQIVDLSRSNDLNMRIVGPNCMGILNTHSPRLNATFAPKKPLMNGRIGFISQSGALGVVVMEYATKLGLGFSKFVSLGNKADVNGTDMIQNLGNDPNTDVILAYLESFADPWNFAEIATKTSKKKPILMVKSGRTRAGARAATSHTGALATAETALSATLSSSGVIRVSSVEELFDCASAFSKMSIPDGDKVCIITNAGGPGTLTVDALINNDLHLADLSEETKTKIQEFLAEEASVENPIDMLASANPDQYKEVLNVVIQDEQVDSLIIIFVPPLMIDTMAVVEEIQNAVNHTKKPILAVMMGRAEILQENPDFNFPIYEFPESAVIALKAMTSYALWKRQPEEIVEKLVTPKKSILNIIPKAIKNKQTSLTPNQIQTLFEGYGFQFPTTKIINSQTAQIGEIINIGNEIGYPVVVKMGTPLISHKTDKGGVILDIRTESELIKALGKINQKYNKMKIPENEREILIQKYYHGGIEMALGSTLDPQFGPILMIGSGGILVEVLNDVRFGVVPLKRSMAKSLIESLKGYPLLLGYRGDEPSDIEKLEEALLRLSQLIYDNKQINEIDINPLLVLPKGNDPIILDARVSLHH